MALQTIPPRIKWAVDLMDLQPHDQVLETFELMAREVFPKVQQGM